MAIQPQSRRATPTVNENLRDRGISHAVALERLKSGEAQKIITFVEDELLPDLLTKLEARLALIETRGFDLGPSTTRRLEELITALRASVDAFTTSLSADIVEVVGEVSTFEAQWAAATMHDGTASLPIQVDVTVPSVETMRAAVMSRPLDGILLTDWVSRLDLGTKLGLERAVRVGIASGETTAQIITRARQLGGTVAANAEAIVRTAVAHAASTGRDSVYEANADLLRGIQWVATLDTRTCPTCGPLDGKLFRIGEGPRSPLHIQCRCTTVPVLKSWSQLGIDAKDIPASTRASMDGQVPHTLNFGEWLKGRSAADQDDALGPTRGKLFRTGAIQVKDFVNPRGELLTLDDLRARYADVFNRAGL